MSADIDAELAALDAELAAQDAAHESARKVQTLVDRRAWRDLRTEHGHDGVARVTVAFTPGLVTFAVVRTPKDAEIKRYRSRVKPNSKGLPGDQVAAAEELAAVCRVYPDSDAYAALCAVVPGLHAQMGVVAITLAVGEAEAEGKG